MVAHCCPISAPHVLGGTLSLLSQGPLLCCEQRRLCHRMRSYDPPSAEQSIYGSAAIAGQTHHTNPGQT
jgi:hypothetical protein